MNSKFHFKLNFSLFFKSSALQNDNSNIFCRWMNMWKPKKVNSIFMEFPFGTSCLPSSVISRYWLKTWHCPKITFKLPSLFYLITNQGIIYYTLVYEYKSFAFKLWYYSSSASVKLSTGLVSNVSSLGKQFLNDRHLTDLGMWLGFQPLQTFAMIWIVYCTVKQKV